jgi:hypothetical protein
LDAAATVAGVFPATPQTVTYIGFDKVAMVKQGNDSICYTYGQERMSMPPHLLPTRAKSSKSVSASAVKKGESVIGR